MTFQLHHGDCLEVLKTFPDNSFDSIVTDPPYGISFMGKKWDYDVPSVEVWAECLRVLKPGGHLLSFAGTRTQHRMAVRIEDAGFEIRDMIAWVYGTGFPKSLDVSKAIDKAAGAERERFTRSAFGAGGNFNDDGGTTYGTRLSDEPATDAARQWQGWGTALKPALEPITVARKPLVGTVAANVLEHGTGALNIDGCRVPSNGESLNGGRISTKTDGWDRPWKHDGEAVAAARARGAENVARAEALGRWPANLIHDGSDEVLAGFPQAGGGFGVRGGRASTEGYRMHHELGQTVGYGDTGSAARFFYCAKASRADRNSGLTDPGPQFKRGTTLRDVENTATTGNTHPTVKPTELMRYLLRLVTPPGGRTLDPYVGSGSTGKAAVMEGFDFVGIERDAEYIAIAKARIEDEIIQATQKETANDVSLSEMFE